jgi:hypothetical protein
MLQGVVGEKRGKGMDELLASHRIMGQPTYEHFVMLTDGKYTEVFRKPGN